MAEKRGTPQKVRPVFKAPTPRPETKHEELELPLGEDVLDSLQFGGKRNYGYGTVPLKDTQLVPLDELDYARLHGADACLIEVVPPFVLESEYPDASDRLVP